MRRLGPRLLIVLATGIGGGSLVLFAYFLVFGPPFAITLAHSQAARLAWDCLLSAAFFLQHSGMIRHGAQDRLASRVPTIYQPALYAVASGTVLLAVIVLWQPTDRLLLGLDGAPRWFLRGLSVLAMAGFAWVAHSLEGLDAFGTRALSAHLRGVSPSPAKFVARGPYRYVRHPLYLLTLLIMWLTPHLPSDRLLFNVLWTAWIVLGAKLEERDLLLDFGPAYRRYQDRVPMLIPSLRSLTRHSDPDAD